MITTIEVINKLISHIIYLYHLASVSNNYGYLIESGFLTSSHNDNKIFTVKMFLIVRIIISNTDLSNNYFK